VPPLPYEPYEYKYITHILELHGEAVSLAGQESERSLPSSQKARYWTRSEPDQSSIHPYIVFFKNTF